MKEKTSFIQKLLTCFCDEVTCVEISVDVEGGRSICVVFEE